VTINPSNRGGDKRQTVKLWAHGQRHEEKEKKNRKKKRKMEKK
jgi:hypothetical protein